MGKYKEKPRYNVISMRISDTERKELEQIALRHSLSISSLMRQVVEAYTNDFAPVTASHQPGLI